MTGTTITRKVLTGSTDGRPVSVVATGSPGTSLHTVGTYLEEVWLWATNQGATEQVLNVEFGGTASTDALVFKIPPQETVLVSPGLNLQNSLSVTAYATTTATVMMAGYANVVQQL